MSDELSASDADCIFCSIVAGTIPSKVVYEDATTLAFLDIFPANPGHTLIIPKAHVANLLESTPEGAAAVIQTARIVARMIDEKLEPEGFTLFQTVKPAGWQDVQHLHVHVIPRWSDDALVPPWKPVRATDEQLDIVLAQLR